MKFISLAISKGQFTEDHICKEEETSKQENQNSTIRLLHTLVIEVCVQGLGLSSILKKAFEILLCFDDVISLGYRESVTNTQVLNSLEMESSEEKLHLMLRKARENEAKENARKHIIQTEKLKKLNAGQNTSSSTGNYNSLGSNNNNESNNNNLPQTNLMTGTGEKTSSLTSGANISNFNESYNNPSSSSSTNTFKKITTAPQKGMQLGKKRNEIGKKKDNNVDSFEKVEKKEMEVLNEDNKFQDEENKEQHQIVNPLKAPVNIEFIEKFNCNLTRDGALNSFEILGEMNLFFIDQQKSRVQIFFNLEQQNKNFVFKPYPTLNKPLWVQKSIISLKDEKETFPVNVIVPTIKYKYVSNNSEEDLPFTFTHWYNDGSLTLELEFNASQKRFKCIQDLVLIFPTKEIPNVESIENSKFNMNGNLAQWNIEYLSEDSESSSVLLKFAQKYDGDNFFPMKINFNNDETFLKIQATKVVNLNDGAELKFDFKKKFQIESFKII